MPRQYLLDAVGAARVTPAGAGAELNRKGCRRSRVETCAHGWGFTLPLPRIFLLLPADVCSRFCPPRPLRCAAAARFRRLISARVCLTVATQIQGVVVSWQIFKLTGDPLALGLIGLAEAIPSIAVSLYAGHVADSVRRKNIIVPAVVVLLLCAAALWALAHPLGQALLARERLLHAAAVRHHFRERHCAGVSGAGAVLVYAAAAARPRATAQRRYLELDHLADRRRAGAGHRGAAVWQAGHHVAYGVDTALRRWRCCCSSALPAAPLPPH